ncbi:hypothetical protein [Mycolicibacter heraklionensis]|uniref:hypothetical protein n=1 Tax=Mycolicibacter heraklionensis TaxID=512402 RepID=UPI0007EA273B|nr:hypothetical protein [Mycolicibacter heraklionensis]OBG39345.1 hypothetical protein A5671_01795 [Mycolicibacter heraklionensis]
MKERLLDAIGQFYWTPGWGNLGTITVGVLAIVASGISSRRALRRSEMTLKLAEETYAANERRYEQDRHDAHKQRVRVALYEAVHAVRTWASSCEKFEILVLSLAYAHRHGDREDQRKVRSEMVDTRYELNVPHRLEAVRRLEVIIVLSQDNLYLTAQIQTLLDAYLQATEKFPEIDSAPEELESYANSLMASRKAVISANHDLSKLGSVLLKPNFPNRE